MNILLVSGIFVKSRRDILGGMAKAVYMTAKGLIERGNEVKILTTGGKNLRWDYNGIDVFTIKADNSLNHKNVLKDFYRICCREIHIEREVVIINREWKIDIIQYTGWFGVGLFHFTKTPAIMRISSYTKFQLYSNFFKNNLILLNKLERMAANRMNAVFAPSNVIAEAVSNDIKRKVFVIETPFMPEYVEEDNKIVNSKLCGKRYILFFGRLSVDKGIMVIKKVMHKILEKYGDLYFVFAGPDYINIETGKKITEELIHASKEYKDRVIFLGYLQHQVLFPVIRRAELILMPSLMDNFPNSCAEAMALGSIVIGTDGSSLEQFITDGYNGFLAEINNSESLKKKIIECLELGAVEKEMIKHRAVERVNSLNDNSYFDKLDKLYKTVIKRSNSKFK